MSGIDGFDGTTGLDLADADWSFTETDSNLFESGTESLIGTDFGAEFAPSLSAPVPVDGFKLPNLIDVSVPLGRNDSANIGVSGAFNADGLFELPAKLEVGDFSITSPWAGSGGTNDPSNGALLGGAGEDSYFNVGVGTTFGGITEEDSNVPIAWSPTDGRTPGITDFSPGLFTGYRPAEGTYVDPEGNIRHVDVNHGAIGFDLSNVPLVGPLLEKGPTDFGVGVVGGLGLTQGYDPEKNLNFLEGGIQLGGNGNLGVSFGVPGTDGALNVSAGGGGQALGTLAASVGAEATPNIAPFNDGNPVQAAAHIDHLFDEGGGDALLQQFANQRFLSEDGVVRNHGSLVGGQYQNATNVLSETAVDGQPLFDWNDYSVDNPPTQDDIDAGVAAAIEAGVDPTSFAGTGGLNFGQTSVGDANVARYGVGEVTTTADAAEYTELPDDFRYNPNNTVTDWSDWHRDVDYSAVNFDPNALGEPIQTSFPGIAEVTGRLIHDGGAEVGTGIVDAWNRGQHVVTETFNAAEEGLQDAGQTVGDAAQTLWDGTVDAVKNVPDAVGDAWNGATDWLNPFDGR